MCICERCVCVYMLPLTREWILLRNMKGNKAKGNVQDMEKCTSQILYIITWPLTFSIYLPISLSLCLFLDLDNENPNCPSFLSIENQKKKKLNSVSFTLNSHTHSRFRERNPWLNCRSPKIKMLCWRFSVFVARISVDLGETRNPKTISLCRWATTT